jgi:hypothetical protein
MRRSEERGQALAHQLEASVARTGARFMVLADSGGLLLASSDAESPECEEVAARLAALGLCEDSVGEIWRADRSIAALSFSALGQRLLLGIGGPDVEGALPEVRRAIAGAKRILA